MKTLTAQAWHYPHDDLFSLFYRDQVVASKDKGFTIVEAKQWAHNNGYTHIKIDIPGCHARTQKL